MTGVPVILPPKNSGTVHDRGAFGDVTARRIRPFSLRFRATALLCKPENCVRMHGIPASGQYLNVFFLHNCLKWKINAPGAF